MLDHWFPRTQITLLALRVLWMNFLPAPKWALFSQVLFVAGAALRLIWRRCFVDWCNHFDWRGISHKHLLYFTWWSFYLYPTSHYLRSLRSLLTRVAARVRQLFGTIVLFQQVVQLFDLFLQIVDFSFNFLVAFFDLCCFLQNRKEKFLNKS